MVLSAVLTLTILLGGQENGERSSRISDESVPLIDPEAFPSRPGPLLEWGNPLLGTGNIERGFTLPTGAVWQPQLIIYGSARSALQTIDQGEQELTEWANRLDLFANLQLSGTERLVLGVRPLDRDGGFSGYRFDGGTEGSFDNFNDDITTFFFEGDLGEIFPNADPDDDASLDWGFAVGRQPISYQEGMLINDDLDALGIIRNTLLPAAGSDLQVAFVYAWDEIHRADRLRARDADLYGMFAAWDLPRSTVRADAVLVQDARGDSLHAGVEAVQRIGHYNTVFRIVGSAALDEESDVARDGAVAMAEISWTPPWTHDNVYINAFIAADEYTPAAQMPTIGGPLGRIGIAFESAQLGAYGAPLDSRPDQSFGGALGYQWFGKDTRSQWVLELAGHESRGRRDTGIALSARFQKAVGRRFVLRLDGFIADSDARGNSSGLRTEWAVNF